MRAPEWLRRGRTPAGQVMTRLERRLLRVVLSIADDEGWFSKTFEYLGEASGQHRTNVPRQLRKFVAWGLLSPAKRRLANGQLREGWLIDVAQVRPVPRERDVDLGEYRRLKRHARDLEARLRERDRLVSALRLVGPVTMPPPGASELVRGLAEGLGVERCYFVEIEGERLYGSAKDLGAVVDAGLAEQVQDEPMWPVDRGVVPLSDSSTLRDALAHRMGRDTDYRIIETLRWYRAELAHDPKQLNYYGPQLFARAGVWGEAEQRAALRKQEHGEKLRALLAGAGPEQTVTLTRSPHTAMSQEAQHQLLARLSDWEQRRVGAT